MKIKNKKKKNKFLIIGILLIILICGFYFSHNKNDASDSKLKIKSINYYNKYVITNKETNLYDANQNILGKVGKDVELTLAEIEKNSESKLFKIADLDGEYYISYKDISKLDELSSVDDRYKNYIVFNKNIVTNEKTSFYDENGKLIYEFNKSFDLPIIIMENDRYGVGFKDKLLYVKQEDVKEVKENHNTDKTNSSGVGVLNYHAFYDENNDDEAADCNTEICHSKKQFKSHLDYFKNNNILTLKMKEVEMYIDGKIQLPKSVLITFDDGGREQVGIDLLTEYKMYGTIFVVTSWFEPNDYPKTEYIELHSHSHHLHETGDCPTGQGGGIQCLSEEVIQNDLKISREKLNNTTYFCYPFYEYNDYSIKMLKEAGFTMAFIGESNQSDNLVHVNSDKFRLRRFVVVNYTTLNDFDKYFGQIH